MATLADIRTKVRRLTRSPSAAQITDDLIDDYVNNFVLYDFPEQLRLFTNRKTLTFYTEPNIDVYETNTTDATNPLYNFKNAVITVHTPVYIAGYKAYFTLSREDFFGNYPALQAAHQIGTGDGVTTNFTGTLSSTPILRYNVLFSSIDDNNDGLSVYDKEGDGTLTGDTGGASTINYITGVYDITFNVAPGSGETIYAQTVTYQAARPQSILYFDNKFTLRPVPDKPYQVRIEIFDQPTALLDAANEPELAQHWQFIALGAARKILIDRLDMETVSKIEAEYKHQELLCLRRTLVQQSEERTATIYTQQVGLGASGWNHDNLG